MGPGIRTFHHRQADPLVLARAKGRRRVSVCIPARDEAATVGAVVAAAAALSAAHGGPDLVDEVVVVDDRSADDTAAIARAAGARVLTASEDRPSGKGGAMRRALDHTDGDLVVFLDADVENPGPHFVAGLLLPLLTTDGVVLVKGCYDRPLHGRPGEGGRVTELTARPVLSLLFPEVAEVRQPLAGETAAPRWVLDKVDLADGYGVEIALLLDVAERFGPSAIAQVDLGVRVHRNRPLTELGAQAREVLAVALARAGMLPSSDDAERSATADPLDDLTRPVDRTANRAANRPDRHPA